jgi:transposase
MTRYIGLDAHAASCTLAVVGPSGKHISCHVLETRANVLVDLIKTIARPRHLCFEEGTHSGWLYEILSPHLDETVVTGLMERRGRNGVKDDERDAFVLAEKLRTNSIETRVFKDVGRYGKLREISHAYGMLVRDSVRVQNRVRSLYRSRGIETPGDGIYDAERRAEWIAKLPPKSQPVAQLMVQQYDAVENLRADGEKQMRIEARQHPVTRRLETIPGIGPIRAAQLVPIIVSPHRLRTKRQLWKYAGLAIVTRSSSDWVKGKDGGWSRQTVQQTRGLNRTHNGTLKCIFKGAATTVIGRADADCPIYQHYRSMIDNKTKPNLAKLTIARQIAAIALAVWKKEEVYAPAKVKKSS